MDHFCVKLECRQHILNEHLEKLKWTLLNQKFKQCAISTALTFAQNKSLA